MRRAREAAFVASRAASPTNGHLSIVKETFSKSLGIQHWPSEHTESGKHWKAWYSKSSAAEETSCPLQKSWAKLVCRKQGNVADVLSVPVTQPCMEPVLEQEGGEGPFSGPAWPCQLEDLGILGEFAKMSLRRKNWFSNLWPLTWIISFSFYFSRKLYILKFLIFSFDNLQIFSFFCKWTYSKCDFYLRSQEARSLLSYFPVRGLIYFE